jgi:hypothetical protein
VSECVCVCVCVTFGIKCDLILTTHLYNPCAAIETAGEKQKAVADRLVEVLGKIAEVGGNVDVTSQPGFLYLKGKAHNVIAEHSPAAEDALTKVSPRHPISPARALSLCIVYICI